MEDKNKKQENNNSTKSKSNIDREQLPKELKEIIQYIPDDKKDEALKVITAQSIEHSTSFSGPLPPPSILDEYNNVLDNGAERIMKMAENQSNHRIEMEKHAIKEELRQSKTGQNFGFILAIIGMIIAFLLAYLGHDTVAGIFGTTTIVGLVTIFVIGKKRQDKELEE